MGEVPTGQRKPYAAVAAVIGDGTLRALEAWLAQVWGLRPKDIDRLTDAQIAARYQIPWKEAVQPVRDDDADTGKPVQQWAVEYLMKEEGLTREEAVAKMQAQKDELLGRKPGAVDAGKRRGVGAVDAPQPQGGRGVPAPTRGH